MQGDNKVNYNDVLTDVGNQYPALKKHLGNFNIIQSQNPNDGRQLEFYPPWEGRNLLHRANWQLTKEHIKNKWPIIPMLCHLISGCK